MAQKLSHTKHFGCTKPARDNVTKVMK